LPALRAKLTDARESPQVRTTLLLLLVVVGFLIAVGVHYWLAYYLGRPYPESTFLFTPADRFVDGAPGVGVHFFGDFYGTWRHTLDADPYGAPSLFYRSNYFPFTHLLFEPATWLSYPAATAVFLVGSGLGILGAVWAALADRDGLRRALTAVVLTFMTYPVLIALDRGNIETALLLLLLAFLALYARGRPMAAAVPLAMAAAMKLTPLILVLLFVVRRQWRATALTVALTVLLTLAGLLFIPGNLADNADAALEAIRGFTSAAEDDPTAGVRYNTSVTGLFEVASREWSWAEGVRFLATPLSALLLVVSCAVALLPRLELWERVTLLVVAMILVPPVSYDYRLIHLLLPVLLMLRARTPVPVAAVVLLALVLVPKTVPLLFDNVGASTIVNPLLLLAVAGIVVAGAVRRRAWQAAPA
jgi:hypothetical protein